MKETPKRIPTKTKEREKILNWRRENPPRSFGWIAANLGITRTRAYQQYKKALEGV